MRLRDAPQAYDFRDQLDLRRELESELTDRVHRKGQHIELGSQIGVIFVDTVTGTRYRLAVTSGALALTAL